MGNFIIDKGNDDRYYFKLITGSGNILLTSEKYLFKTACKRSIDFIRSNAAGFLGYELGTTIDGKYYFKLKGSNGQIIGRSCIYDSSIKRNNYIELVKNASPYATVIDQTHATAPHQEAAVNS